MQNEKALTLGNIGFLGGFHGTARQHLLILSYFDDLRVLCASAVLNILFPSSSRVSISFNYVEPSLKSLVTIMSYNNIIITKELLANARYASISSNLCTYLRIPTIFASTAAYPLALVVEPLTWFLCGSYYHTDDCLAGLVLLF
jgi:hypothetical protein